MPGDIIHYLHANRADDISQVQYTIFYGWTDAQDLAAATESDRFYRLHDPAACAWTKAPHEPQPLS